MRCSIVIRAYNEEKHIGRLLEGITHQTEKDIEIILVDSGSTDLTTSIAAQYGVKVVHIAPAKFTFGRSLNLGISAATREIITIASAHVYPVYPDWIENLHKPFSNPQVALSYGKQRGSKSSKFSEHQIFHQWYPDYSQSDQKIPFCNNANSAIRRALWKENPYDESLTGLEDVAWAKWAISTGHVIAYTAEAEVVHIHHETPYSVYNRYRREAMAFKQLYLEAHFSLYDVIRLTTSNIINDIWYAARQRVFLKCSASIFWFRVMQFWGTHQGYRQSAKWNWQLRQTFYYPRGRIVEHESTPRQVKPIRYN